MAALSLSQMLERLNTKLSDSNDKTFTSSEKGEFLTSAYNDPNVFYIDRDTSLTTSDTSLIYALPANCQDVTDVFIDTLSDDIGTLVDRDSYSLINGSLYFDEIHRWLPSGKTIILFYKHKVTTSDDLPDFLQEYVLTLAEIEAYSFMKNKFSTRFLKNDVSMAELINSLSERKQHAQELRRQLANKRAIAG